jgi:hypothetical protein
MRAALEANVISLDAIEAAIRVFSPELASEYLPINRPVVPLAEATGEVGRFILSLFRQRDGGAIRTLEAAEELMRVKSLDPRDRLVATLMRKRVTDGFRRLRVKGVVVGQRYGSGTELEWRLVKRC